MMIFDKNKPYNQLPLLPPRAQVETITTLKKAIRAHKALAELKGAGNLIPNQTILLRSIVLQEARLSSEIENIFTTNDKLYKAFSDPDNSDDPNTKEVLSYQDALWHGFRELKEGRSLSPSLIVEIVNEIRQNDAGIRAHPGVCIANLRGETIYTPPEGAELIRALLNNLCEYLYADDGQDSLIKLAVQHYQFEAIHPFSDGNGRTGRVLNILYLVSEGLLDVPVLYLSRYIIDNKVQYYRKLKQVTEEGAWEDWVSYILEAVEDTATKTCDKIHKIRQLLDDCLELARGKVKKGYSKELIELIFQQPYCRIQSVEKAGLAKRETASAYLKELERVGILRGLMIGREKYYINDRLFDVLAE
jgi:Fic family protein